jgi:hypothetical protein
MSAYGDFGWSLAQMRASQEQVSEANSSGWAEETMGHPPEFGIGLFVGRGGIARTLDQGYCLTAL